MKHLDDAVAEYYVKQELDPEVMLEILTETEEIKGNNGFYAKLFPSRSSIESEGFIPSAVPLTMIGTATAALIVVAVTAGVLMNSYSDKGHSSPLTQASSMTLATASPSRLPSEVPLLDTTVAFDATTTKLLAADNPVKTAMNNSGNNSGNNNGNNDLNQKSLTPQQSVESFNEQQIDSELLATQLINNSGMHTETAKIVLQEASLNHRSKLKLDYETAVVPDLAMAMSKLDFDIQLPEGLPDGLAVVGGRYCTIAGRLAAHVKLKGEGQKTLSLFMTPVDPGLDAIANRSESFSEGVQVSSWREKGLLYLAATANETLKSQ